VIEMTTAGALAFSATIVVKMAAAAETVSEDRTGDI